MLRRTPRQLRSVAAVGLAVVGAGDGTRQRNSLHRLLRDHDEGVAANAKGTITVASTYDVESALYYDQYNMAVMPCVSGGAARQALRAKLIDSGAVAGVRERLLAPWQAEGERRVVVFGCRSVAYLKRQLLADTTHSFLVVDPSLKELMGAAAALTPVFAHRVFFLRCESMFTCLQVLQPETADVAVVPMPVPFWSRHGSHRRLVHFDFYCAAHSVLRVREAPTDPRGVVLFTDCEPYAAFMMEHLEEAKLVVPYTRKNPAQLFQRWLPQDELIEDVEGGAQRRRREFPKQRDEEVVALAAAKSGATTPDARRLLSAYSYSRKYYRDFAEERVQQAGGV
ncbi:conserved hypothetical protein [Leishmania major strain Friedlin]|uniref:Uncharacterized protein n=1 Tax=Leishmania major TaxID=5664 RepID=Q4QJJ1_LEIMA|nr:conserved hypothetical protein [Leishmania major strain Friedlin]CAG9568190.1 hypothetical_protein_-_conserved [Leishmania major strain Friedlin]CAJ01928.1 conserved hypothetical protein [Leishmania major strain Friedlin]|eukprot:XP_001687488.1 conserved hypothetical protein [Leishmania major strain Friedlin]